MTPTQLSDVLTRTEAARYLKICKSTLAKLDVPKIQVRRRVLFTKTALDAWLDQHTQAGKGAFGE